MTAQTMAAPRTARNKHSVGPLASKTRGMATLDLLVLRCTDIRATRSFYELVGVAFVLEQHGGGPDHFAAALDEVTFEMYPATPTRPPEPGLRIGVRVDDEEAIVDALVSAGHLPRHASGPVSFVDPDERIVAISGRP